MPDNVFLEDVEPSRGRVRIVDLGAGRVGWQDPDVVQLWQRPDGSTFELRNVFVDNEYAIRRTTYDFEVRKFVDSLGYEVPVSAYDFRKAGTVVEYKTVEAEWLKLPVDPRTYRPGANEEIVERIVFIDREGRVHVESLSYGEGQTYDPSVTGEKWRYLATKYAGETDDPGEGFRTGTNQLYDQTVLSREFVLKTMVPRAPGVAG